MEQPPPATRGCHLPPATWGCHLPPDLKSKGSKGNRRPDDWLGSLCPQQTFRFPVSPCSFFFQTANRFHLAALPRFFAQFRAN